MEPKEETLMIDGMTCEGCARSVRAALLRVPGIIDAAVDHTLGRATIVGERIERGAIAAELADAGFALK